MIKNYKWCHCCGQTRHLDNFDRGSHYCKRCHLTQPAQIIALEQQQRPRFDALLAECRRKARFPGDAP